MAFTKAIRQQAKLRLALTGPSGAGKTYSALILATVLGKRVAVIDTERSSASLYAEAFAFDTMDLPPPYTPERFIEAVSEAERAGYDVVIIDSITHEWNGIGGCLEINETLAAAKYRGNTWSAWNETTPRHRAFLDKLMAANCHIIATMRSKTETAQVDDGARKKVVKLGMKSEQREGTDFEFSIVLDLIHDGHYAVASKDRTGLFAKLDPAPITADTARMLAAWLQSAKPAPVVQPQRQPEESRGMDEMYLHEVAEAIRLAHTVTDLSAIHDDAMKVCKDAGDRETAKRLKALLTERKKQLEQEAQP